jgi:hypothetical protein
LERIKTKTLIVFLLETNVTNRDDGGGGGRGRKERESRIGIR